MMFSQYCRIESNAGGVSCTVREFVRAAHSCLLKRYRFGKGARETRTSRHLWLRDGLKQRLEARKCYSDVVSGNLYSHILKHKHMCK